MAIGSKRHGKKTDKETQSPMLKIFKDIMQKEKRDPEKANLLANNKEERKKKYRGPKTKPDRRSRESSSSEQLMKNPYSMPEYEQRAAYDDRTHSIPFHGDKKDSWFCWTDNERKTKKTEDTFSCVSCALKKIASSEYACVGCLLVILTISIVVAFLVVCKNMPCLVASEKSTESSLDSDRLKRKIEQLKENRIKNGITGQRDYDSISPWKEKSPIQMNGISEIAGSEFGSSFRELNNIDDAESKFTGDLNSILDDQINQLQTSDRLRDFYSKLMETDKQIRNLKKSYAYTDNNIEDIKNVDRMKRSLKFHISRGRKDHFRGKKSANNTSVAPKYIKFKGRNHRHRRLTNNTKGPMGFVIEKKKVLVEYKPSMKKVPKCSHAPKESNTHEKQLKHPFYKNTQRLDELLDKFLNKNIPEIMNDPFGFDALFGIEKTQPKTDESGKKKEKQKSNILTKSFLENDADILKIINPESTTYSQKGSQVHKSHFPNDKLSNQNLATKSDYNVILSVSTIMNPGTTYLEKTSTMSTLESKPNLRRLLQVEGDDEENLGYEDFNEVLKDDLNNHDEFDKVRNDRKKRMEDSEPNNIEDPKKINPFNLNNPNWKGPMPLYPDELNAMMKQAPANNNKEEFPVSTKEIVSELDKTKRDLTDIEYVEDYLNNKYGKLVQMAQAYSDYGVLDGKKEERNEKNSAADEKTERKVKLSANVEVRKRGLFYRKKNPQENEFSKRMITKLHSNLKFEPSEGIRFEIRPTRSNNDDDIYDASILLANFTNDDEALSYSPTSSNFIYITSDTDIFDATYTSESPSTKSRIKDANTKENVDSRVLFPFGRLKRSLLSVDLKTDNISNKNKFTTKRNIYDVSTHEKTRKISEITTKIGRIDSYRNNNDYMHDNLETTPIVTMNTVDDNNGGIETETTIVNFDEYPSTVTIKYDMDAITYNLENTNIFTNTNKEEYLKNYVSTAVDIPNSNINNKNESKSLTITETSENSREPSSYLNSYDDDDDKIYDFSETISFPLLLSFNNNMDYNKSNVKVELMASHEESDYTTIHKRDVMSNDTNIRYYYSKSDHSNNTNNISNDTTKNINDSLITNVITPENNTKNHENKCVNHLCNVISENITNGLMNDTKNEISVSDFFMILSDWFRALEGENIPENSLNTNTAPATAKNDSNATTESVYPMYDSEVIANIGHRSRVLMSMDTASNNTKTKEKDDAKTTEVKSPDVKISSRVLVPVETSTNTSQSSKANVTQEVETIIATNSKDRDDNVNENKTIVKRNADDSNLIFWNDIYDEEYGVETKPLDNTVRDKHSIKENGFIKKSGVWMQDKIKKLTQNLKKSSTTTAATTVKRIYRDVEKSEADIYPKYVYDKINNRIMKRQTDASDEDDYEANHKSVFKAMTTNMKEVCKKAARAVQQSRNIEVRQDSKQETIASTLMQQLMGLMNDLVDYQVQQKTCAKLPPDLQSFLEWLTSPDEEKSNTPQANNVKDSQEDFTRELDMGSNFGISSDNPYDQSTVVSNEKVAEDPKTQYLGTLRNVQDLIQKYEAMTDEDKSKMTGVKKYLEDQLDYLNGRISGYNDYNIYSNYPNTASIRFRRELARKNRLKRRNKRKLQKFMRNFGKKHTRTTVSFHDMIQLPENKRSTIQYDDDKVKGINKINEAYYNADAKNAMTHKELNEMNKNNDNIDRSENDIDISKDVNAVKNGNALKRNLKDVYYKAIEDAKRFTTVDSNMQTNIIRKQVSHLDFNGD